MITVNKACIDLLKGFEAFRAKPYHGAADRPDVFTIGYGTTIYPDGKKVSLNDEVITEAKATEYLIWKVNSVVKNITPMIKQKLSDNQFAALVSFAYNVGEWGINGLQGSTLLKKVNTNPIDNTIRDEFMRWVNSNGKPVEGLRRRRTAEADLYFTP